MKHPLLKTVIAVLLASCLSSLLFFAFTTASGITGFREETQNASVKLDGITMNIKNIISSSNKLAYDYSERLATDAYLFSIALEDEVRVRGDAAIRDYDKGFVVKKLNSGFRLPEDAEDLPALEAMEYVGEPPVAIESSTPLSGESGVFWSRRPSDPEGSYLLCV